MWIYVTVCCSVLQRVAVCCSVCTCALLIFLLVWHKPIGYGVAYVHRID